MALAPAAPPEMPPAMLGARLATAKAKVPVTRTAPAFTVRVPDTSTSPVCVTLPAAEIDRLLKLFPAFRIAMLLTPLIVTVLAPFVKTEPSLLVSHVPACGTEPVANEIAPVG